MQIEKWVNDTYQGRWLIEKVDRQRVKRQEAARDTLPDDLTCRLAHEAQKIRHKRIKKE